MAGAGPSQTFFKIFGIIYGVVAILGFFYGDDALLGIVANNTADTWLYVALVVVMLFFGFAPSGSKAPV
jgi:hypothetical protein